MINISFTDSAEVIARKVADSVKDALYHGMYNIHNSDVSKHTKLRAIRLIVERWGGEDV